MALILVLVACCTVAAAETEFELKPCSGKMALDENTYIVLTPDNLSGSSQKHSEDKR